MRYGRYQPFYLARDYARKVIQAGKCRLDGPDPYKPLFTAMEFPSKGFRTSARSWLTRRPGELMSSHEHDAYYWFHTKFGVIDIAEQCALPPAETMRIAHELGVRHPAVAEGEIIMSTDFVVTINDRGAYRRRAYAVKRECDITPRVLEKLAIEREYWNERGVRWTLLLETALPKVRVQNMWLVFAWHDASRIACDVENAMRVRSLLHERISKHDEELRRSAARCDSLMRLRPGTSLGVAYNALVTGEWQVDWDRPFQTSLTLCRSSKATASSSL